MNHVIDDTGRTVIACGSPGSIVRIRCEHPALIARINALYVKTMPAPDAAEAIRMIREAGVSDDSDIHAILMASSFGIQPFVHRCD